MDNRCEIYQMVQHSKTNSMNIDKAAKKYAIDRGKEGFIRLNTASDIDQRRYSFKAGAEWALEQFKAEQESDSMSIDELLSEFKRHGFDVSNWDGEEGAEKAIVDGVVNHIEQFKAQQKQSDIDTVYAEAKSKFGGTLNKLGEMIPQEKAKELVQKYFNRFHRSSDLELSWKECKQCALIAVDEILNIQVMKNGYWQQVKEEIEKL